MTDEERVKKLRAELEKAEEVVQLQHRPPAPTADERLFQARCDERSFLERHGKPMLIGRGPSQLGDADEWAFSDGARRIAFQYGPPSFLEPSPDRTSRTRVRLSYQKALLARAERDFADCREACHGRRYFQWPAEVYESKPPVDNNINHLRALQEIVLTARVVIKYLEAKLAATPEEVARRRQEEARRESEARDAKHRQMLADQINCVEI